MANIQKVTVVWSGLPGFPGTTTLYRPDDISDDDNIHEFFEAIKTKIPSGLNIIVQPFGNLIDEFTGDLTGAWTHAPTATTSTSGGGIHAAGTGGSIELRTGAVANGRRVKGRLYLVPLPADLYDTTGTLDNTALGTFQTAANGLVGDGGELLVWHRPTTVGGTDGAGEPVTSAFMRDRVSILRSRRA